MILDPLSVGSWQCKDDPGEPTTGTRRISITDQEAAILRALAYNRSVLEIGTGLGVSTKAMSETANRVVTIDPDPWVANNVSPTLGENVTLHTDRTGIRGEFTLAFVDADHRYDAVVADYLFAKAHLAPNGLAVFHDTKMDGVRAALDECGVWVEIDTHYGLGIVW